MNLMVKLRRGEGPFWGRLKTFVLGFLRFHIPVVGVLRLLFGFLYAIHIIFRGLVASLTRFFWFEPLFRSQCFRIGIGFRMNHVYWFRGAVREIRFHPMALSADALARIQPTP